MGWGTPGSWTELTITGTQSLASLADEEFTGLGAEIDNTVNRYHLGDFELSVGSLAVSGADAQINLYLVPAGEGDNYTANWVGNVTSDQQQNEQYFVTAFVMRDETTAQEAIARGVELPNGKFRWAVRNRANVAFPASGNKMRYRGYDYS